MKFSPATIAQAALPLGKSDHIEFDDALKGFGLRIRAGGKKTYIVQYRIGPGQRRLTLGSAETLTPDAARKRAREALAKVQLGQDPQLQKLTGRVEAGAKLSGVITQYLDGPARQKLKDSSYRETARYLRQNWQPLHKFPVAQIERKHVAAELNKIATVNGPYAANRARAALSALFTWLIGQGLADKNPVMGTMKAANETRRERVLTPQEIVELWQRAGGGDFGDIVRILILTGQRREEVGSMCWSDLNLQQGSWRIPAHLSKNSREHLVPLSRGVIDILQQRALPEGRDLVFGKNGPFSGWSKAKKTLDTRVRFPPWRLHDLRRTVATGLADLRIQPHIIEAILNHISGHKAGVAGIYNRSTYEQQKREALDLWADKLKQMGCT